MPYQELTVRTHSRIELVDITAQIQKFIRENKKVWAKIIPE